MNSGRKKVICVKITLPPPPNGDGVTNSAVGTAAGSLSAHNAPASTKPQADFRYVSKKQTVV